MSRQKKSSDYLSDDIEVLSGLEPVRRRPGMYTDTTRPNHLAHEAVDNSVDEAIAGYATKIDVILHDDGSLTVTDNGRGMPVDIHPEQKIPGVELILTRLHAGAKFSKKTYKFSGGLHGVGISVVNALSSKLIATIKRDGKIYEMEFADGETKKKLKTVGETNVRDTGTIIHFWPNAKYFDSANFSLHELENVLRAKAVLCPGLSVTFTREATGEKKEWHYEDGLKDYLLEQLENKSFLPQEPLMGHFENNETADWAMVWSLEENASVTESYVNLIPTVQGGTHVAGLKQGLIDAMREFCDLHNLLPRGVKLSSDDSWDQCNFILSVKLTDPQFSGQTKEKLSSMECQTFVSGIVKDAFSLWLNTHIEEAKSLAELVIDNAQKRLRKAKTVTRKKVTTGPALPGKLTDCISQESDQCELFIVEGDSAGGSAKQARDKNYQAILPIRGKILNTWEVSSDQVLASQEVHDIAVALGVDPDSDNLSGLRYGKICILADADSDGAHIATLLCALFFKHFPVLVRQGHVHVAMPPLYRIDVGKEMFYALDDAEKQGILDQITAEKKRGTAHIQRFKGLGEMNPSQLRETTMNPETRRLVQLTLQEESKATDMMDLLLAKQRANDRKKWLEEKGDLAEVS